MAMSANIRAVNTHKRQLNLSVFASLLEQHLYDFFQNAVLLVVAKTMVHTLVRRIMTWQIPPGSAGAEYPQNTVEHFAD